MPVTTPRHRMRISLWLALITLLLAPSAWAGTSLLERYHQIKSGEAATLPGTAITLTSAEQGEVLSAEVSSILQYPFGKVAAALAQAENWCQFMPLHFNIKACTYAPRTGGEVLTLYSGRKYYESPEDSFKMAYRFEILRQDDAQLSLRLSADQGPAGTHDYRIELDALQVEEGTLLHIQSSYKPSMLSSLLTSTYLATLGRDKVGFSHIEQNGETQLVQGIRGVIERNVMRYQLAVAVFLSTQNLPAPSRREAQMARWFKQNDSYPHQLHEMTKIEYLNSKRREWLDQQRLQEALNERIKVAATPP